MSCQHWCVYALRHVWVHVYTTVADLGVAIAAGTTEGSVQGSRGGMDVGP